MREAKGRGKQGDEEAAGTVVCHEHTVYRIKIVWCCTGDEGGALGVGL